MLAEKPSVARDIASVLGATRKRDGYLHGNGYVVTWAIGHLAALAQPHEKTRHFNAKHRQEWMFFHKRPPRLLMRSSTTVLPFASGACSQGQRKPCE